MIGSRFIATAVAMLTVAGCVSGDESRGLGLDGWVGATDRELVLSWGAPDAVYQLADGSRVLTWRSVHIEAAGDYTAARSGVADGQSVAPAPVRYECITNIEVGPLGDIRDYVLQGNGCPRQPE